MSVLTVLQVDGGARSSVQIVSCGCPQTRWCIFGSQVENSSVTFVENGVNFGGGEVCLCVSTANFGQDVCVCVGGWLVKLGLASGWPVRCQTNLTSECWIPQVK